ncbi:MAG: DEAD/DEAH box helicase [Candidatus Obscuribacter sp.]|nr:DEAD/DEAH box helicase [Candidatus Obscuribacter sp.]
MLPSVLAAQIQKGIEDFLRSTYPITTPAMGNLLDELFRQENLFKGPYLSVDLPFLSGSGEKKYFESLSLDFNPYVHQELAFDRLTDDVPRSTIVATGTGSGKTECFLYPLLEYCYQHKEEHGIKAIIVYPMNALATDQARRIAKTVAASPLLQGNIRAGLFVGEAEKEPRVVMDADMIITDKTTLRQSPPDILLTNYKMLDYMLIRPGDQDLWKHNGPETLKFLVVDELHTFDGAQGTDLACLIRRLKKRLRVPENHLCCVGTSATLGGQGNPAALTEFGQRIFGEKFDSTSVIREYRLSAEQYLEQNISEEECHIVPKPTELSQIDQTTYVAYEEYIRGVYNSWFGVGSRADVTSLDWRIALGNRLLTHSAFRTLLQVIAGKPISYSALGKELARRLSLTGDDSEYLAKLLDSLVALVSYARRGPRTPFLNVRLQLWLRELKRMVAEVSPAPSLRFSDDLTAEQRKNHLAIVYCDDCGATAWSGLCIPERQSFSTDLRAFYDAFFSDDRNIRFIFPLAEEDDKYIKPSEKIALCSQCLRINLTPPGREITECSDCGDNKLISASMPDISVRGRSSVGVSRDCPICASSRDVRLIGAQAANLSGIVVSNLFSSPWNRDKRLIAFSDSVQDASHKAGYIRTRGSHITLRTALQKFLASRNEEMPFMTLADEFLSDLFSKTNAAEVIGTFLPGDLEFHEDYDLIKEGRPLPEQSSLRFAFDTRIRWELFAEFGIRARIGRTLEKAGCAVAQIESDALGKAVHDLYETYINEDGNFRRLEEADISGFLTGLLMHQKLNGGIIQEFLQRYIEGFGIKFRMKPDWIWQKSGLYTFPPKFITDGRTDRSDFEQIIGDTKNVTWFYRWLLTCFGEIGATLQTEPDKLYELALRALTKTGILQELQVGQTRVWGINPEKLSITKSVKHAECQKCHHELSVGQAESAFWTKTKCLRKSCGGRYALRDADFHDYYRTLFTRGDVLKIVPAEHTGLLERDTREKVENSFINHKYPWDPNVLSATSTLEMGIDIGDLSSVLLCSMPPSQANYLQRIGRAGRRDGNSLAITVANGRSHDLYFFAAPNEMIAGSVQSPGVFLNASAILERQLTAYCFDHWVASGISDNDFPTKLELVLNNIDRKQTSVFPYNWIQFVRDNRADLLGSFIQLFGSEVTEDTISQLTSFFEQDKTIEGSLEWRVINGLEELARERSSTRAKLRTLDKRIKEKKASPIRDNNFEQELDELSNEKSGLQEIVSRINKKPTLEFFTDEGFIPNYAFPEAGVTLRSVIYRRKERRRDGDNERAYEYWTYNYERPSSAAISELAPANFFYAEGRKVKIDQINMDVSEVEDWRLCPNCSCCRRIFGDDNLAACPNCGDAMWADVRQRKQMIRLRQVMATSSAAKSSIGDEKEERTPAYFNKQLLVTFDKQYLKDAFSLDDASFPFGFEYSSKTTFREINSGEKTIGGEQIYIAGIQSPRKGFFVCKECGKVQPRRTGEQIHTNFCTARNQAAEKNLVELLYLYREFTSEAVRILLPATTFVDSEQLIHSFVAALQMGIREWYGGKVDHLKTTVYEEPIEGTRLRKKFVVIYDTVPGGTGYLKQLMRSEDQIIELMSIALSKLNTCSCNQIDLSPGARPKDGCYRCLFAYRSSYDMPKTSRETAKQLLNEIVSRKNLLNRIDTLSSVKVHALLDSELEQRFLEALGSVKLSDRAVTLTKDIVNGKPGFLFRIGEQIYAIEPQVPLGPEQGVSIESCVDYVLYPQRRSNEIKPIAVFLDGFEFHRDRVAQDLRQRAAIARSGKFSVWSLAWDDVEARFQQEKDYFHDFLSLTSNANLISRRKTIAKHLGVEDFIDFHKRDSFNLFLEFLKKPEQKLWSRHALMLAMGFMDDRFSTSEGQNEWIAWHSRAMPSTLIELFDFATDKRVFGLAHHSDVVGFKRLELFTSIPQASLAKSTTDGAYVSVLFDSENNRSERELRREWVGMLRLYNLFHFVPDCFFLTKADVASNSYHLVPSGSNSKVETALAAIQSTEWLSALNYASPTVHKLLSIAKDYHWEVPEVGDDIVAGDGSVIATGELVWPEKKIAVFLEPLDLNVRSPIGGHRLEMHAA